MGKSQAWQQLQGPVGGPEPILAPRHVGRPQSVPPVIRLEFDRSSGGGSRFRVSARPGQDERERGPRFTRCGVESTGFTRMRPGSDDCLHVGRIAGAS